MADELKTILYVEDDPDIAEVTMMTLQDIGGFDVTHCSSGAAALSSYDRVAPQLVLMDVMMPDMDGPETMRRLSQQVGPGLVPVIFMTARAQTHEQAAYIALGAIGVIVKPFDPMILSQQLSSLWEKRHAA